MSTETNEQILIKKQAVAKCLGAMLGVLSSVELKHLAETVSDQEHAGAQLGINAQVKANTNHQNRIDGTVGRMSEFQTDEVLGKMIRALGICVTNQNPKQATADLIEHNFVDVCEVVAQECEDLGADMAFVFENREASDAADDAAIAIRKMIKLGKEGEK